jgi:2-dehydropantoate 2-reductase
LQIECVARPVDIAWGTRSHALLRRYRRTSRSARRRPPEGRTIAAVTGAPHASAFAVLGLGGIGGMLAARTGALCVGTEPTVDAIRASGLTLVHDGMTTVARPEAVTRLERPVVLLVVAVKAFTLEAALERIDPSALDGAVILPLLNGLEHVELLRERFAGRRGAAEATPRRLGDSSVRRPSPAAPVVVAGSIGSVEAFSPEPGFVVQRGSGAAVITAASDEVDRDSLEATLAPLCVPGLEVVVAESERGVLWEKAARLAVLAAASIASGKPVGALRSDPEWRPRVQAALAEACAVAEADGVQLDAAGQWSIVESLPDGLVPSAARDSSVGRPTELDAITGSVVRAARRLGVWTPMLDGLLADAARHS